MHISELAPHHVENPREIVQPGDELRVKILEIDSERRRLSLSAKRVEGQVLPVRRIEPEQPEGADADADAEDSDVPATAPTDGLESSTAPEAAAVADEAEPTDASAPAEPSGNGVAAELGEQHPTAVE